MDGSKRTTIIASRMNIGSKCIAHAAWFRFNYQFDFDQVALKSRSRGAVPRVAADPAQF